MLRKLVAISLVALAACAGEGPNGTDTPDGGASSDANPCGTTISFDPMETPDLPEASSIAPIRAAVSVTGSPGVFDYTWTVTHDSDTITHTQESSDNSQIGFIAADPGIYYVSVNIDGPTGCPYVSQTLNVKAPNANNTFFRLRAVPPSASAPPQEQIVQVRGGADVNRDITLDPGVSAAGQVRNGSSGPSVPAYLKFIPPSTPGAFRELFTDASGNYSTRLVGVSHNVLVIPLGTTTLAPKLVTWTTGTTSLVIGGGTVVTGTVLAPGGGALANAKVQLSAGGVPSTTGITAGNGTFSLRADLPGGPITVKVTPPVSSGLPRLEATGAFNLGISMSIAYSGSLQTCDLSNTPVKRNNVNQANAEVTVVGTLAATAGTVTAGVAATATGSVRIAASADGTGRLPAGSLVPRAASLSAVVQLGAADYAVDTIDTSGCSVASIDAPPLVVAAGTARNISNAPLNGIRVEATPAGVLALADAQVIATTTNTSGAFSLSLAPGAIYDVRFIDPYKRVARREELDIAAATIPTNAILPVALRIEGKVSISGISQPLENASIQLLCTQCTGADLTRPIAETATNNQSKYSMAVPDPGTM